YPCSPSDALGARGLHSFPTRRSSDLEAGRERGRTFDIIEKVEAGHAVQRCAAIAEEGVCFRTHIRILQVDDMCAFNGEELFPVRSEEHTSELQSRENLVCRLLLEKKK